jgi:hypothetical protein
VLAILRAWQTAGLADFGLGRLPEGCWECSVFREYLKRQGGWNASLLAVVPPPPLCSAVPTGQ